MRLHQHDPGRRLSRRRTPGSKLLHGAAGRYRGTRDGHRPGRIAPQEPYPGRGDAIQGAERHHLRQRRVHQPIEQGSGLGRLGRVCRAKRGEPRPRQIARARHQRLSRTDRAARPRDGRHPLRAERRCDDHHRHLGLRPGALVALRPGVGDEAWHPIPKHPPHSGRQRRIDRGRRHRRVQIDDCQRQRDRRRRRQGYRGRPADRRARAGGRRG